jgi:hypothetical protein
MSSRLNRDCCGASFLIPIKSKSFDGVKLLRYDQVAIAISHLKGPAMGGSATYPMLQGSHENDVRSVLRRERSGGECHRVG